MCIPCPSDVIFWICSAIFVTNSLSAACQRQRCTVRQFHFSSERDSVEDHALCGYTFKNLTVRSQKNCFEQCAWDCRCVSFNSLMTSTHHNCQLNDENRHLKPGALKQMEGHSYHEIRIDYNVKVGMMSGEGAEGLRFATLNSKDNSLLQEKREEGRPEISTQ